MNQVISERYQIEKQENLIAELDAKIEVSGADYQELTRLLGEKEEAEFIRQMNTMHAWYCQWQEKLGGAKEKANEDARFVLPNAAATCLLVTMNARELMHFFELRCCNRAQWEIREMAWQMLADLHETAGKE